MSYINLKNPKTEKYLKLVDEIKSENFPWFYNKNVIYFPNSISKIQIPWYSHCVLSRPSNPDEKSLINSNYYEYFENVLREILEFNSIFVKKFYRINVNLTYNFTNLIAPVHVDHWFEHQQLIIYLDNPESYCPTYLFEEKYCEQNFKSCYPPCSFNEILKKFTLSEIIPPEKDKIITFDGLTFHSYSFPKNVGERRMCIIATYSSL